MVRTLDVHIARLSPTALCTQHTHRHLMFGPGTHQLVQAIVQICSCGNRGLQRLQCGQTSARLLQAGLRLNTSCRVRVNRKGLCSPHSHRQTELVTVLWGDR